MMTFMRITALSPHFFYCHNHACNLSETGFPTKKKKGKTSKKGKKGKNSPDANSENIINSMKPSFTLIVCQKASRYMASVKINSSNSIKRASHICQIGKNISFLGPL